jgi:hypothetical protein
MTFSKQMPVNHQNLSDTHDLRLSAWGPYSKKYQGISHIPNVNSGMRFDLCAIPSIYRRQPFIPSVESPSAYHPWQATPDLSFYSHRHELIWKDRLYADIVWLRASESQVFCRIKFVNNTDLSQELSLDLLAYIQYPPAKTYSQIPVKAYQAKMPQSGKWIDGMDYDDLAPRSKDPRDNLVWDAHLRGDAFRDRDGFVGGKGLLMGPWESDTAIFSCAANKKWEAPTLVMRCRTKGDQAARVMVNDQSIDVTPSDDFVTHVLQGIDFSSHQIKVVCLEGRLLLDGFAVVDQSELDQVAFIPRPLNTQPSVEERGNSLVLDYKDIEGCYGLAWDQPDCLVQEYRGDDIEKGFFNPVRSSSEKIMEGKGEGHFNNVYLRPLLLQEHSQLDIYATVVHGDPEEVRGCLKSWNDHKADLAERFLEAEEKAFNMGCNPAGHPYRFSQERMATTVLTNTVYPIRCRGNFIRHYTPGKKWDCLYTWDSGFVGLGLGEIDTDRSIDNLNAYLCPPKTAGAAFIHHGTPLPVQIYQFMELWNRSGDIEQARYFFARLKPFYNFLAGHDPSSTTRTHKSNLLHTWDYFYNSGGWDDYPAQEAVHRGKLTSSVTPAVTTAHVIRIAKFLYMIASELGEPTDSYLSDIAMFSEALQNHSWDEETGYFSYVHHDDKGKPCGIFRHESGQNYNMGLDGLSPLVSGICSREQEVSMVKNLMTPGTIWCPAGLSTVDQTAAYYANSGYWNGAVWMPHQWFIWKALLSLGYADEAYQIANTALEMWKEEVEESYNCYELFGVQSRRGRGWHHFGGLSTPVLCWYNAYYKPGRLTVGLDTRVVSQSFDHGSLEATLHQYGEARHQPIVIAVVEEGQTYDVMYSGQPCSYIERQPGTLEIRLPAANTNGKLSVRKQSSS